MTQYLHQTRIPKSERAKIKHRKWYKCVLCNQTVYHTAQRPARDGEGYKHNWQPFYEVDIHPEFLEKLTERHGEAVYILRSDWTERKKQAYRMYTDYGIETGEMIIPANILGTPENTESEEAVKKLLQKWEAEATQPAPLMVEGEGAPQYCLFAPENETQLALF